jgi:haloalkane dehalogenase
VDFLRTPDARFASLPEFSWTPRYVDVPAGDGGALQTAYVDEGPRDAPVVLMLHGEPSWSFLYRKVIRIVVDSGLRAIAPDLIGFGRSDKPTRREDYTYQTHVDWMKAFLRAIDLRDATLLCQDWGGLIGLRLVAEEGERFAAVVAANTFLPTGDRKAPPAFLAWQQFSQTVPEFPVGNIVKTGCARPLAADVIAAYDAPFPSESYKAGARQFPLLVPTSPDDPASAPNRRAWESLQRWEKPFVTAFGDSDPITAGADRILQERIPGARGQRHVTIEGAGHFLQEDRGRELGDVVVEVARRARG